MNKDFILSISRNRDPFLNEGKENLYDSLFPNDSYMNLEEQDYLVEPILPLLEEIERKSQKNIKKKSNDDEFSSNRLQFLVERKYINKKRGRKAKEKSKKKIIHTNDKEDNLLIKIQIHFFNFIINFCNDCLKKENHQSKEFFQKINYENKRDVKFSYFSSLKKAKIKDLLKMNISIKNKKYKNSYNRTLLEKIQSSSPSLSKLSEMNYLELFEIYYNKGNPLDKIVFENLNVNLSEKTKTFYNLIDKNKNLKKYLIDIAEKYYICNIGFKKSVSVKKEGKINKV